MTKPLKKRDRDRLVDGYCTLPLGDRASPKRGWASKSAAKRALKVARGTWARHGDAKPSDVYRCPCGLWHTTSAVQRTPVGRGR